MPEDQRPEEVPNSEPVDRSRYESSLQRLDDIFRDISGTVTEVSKWRCPYKNVENECTANFGCRNQDRSVPEGDLFICTSDDKLDYRSAWDISDERRTTIE
ncbi:MAG: hypothetical protein O2821_12830 [Chloroflexi bacterium]|nr:hypothetical protein [Chloroflexota bacterium]MDA1228999.1 hypothetical protein [Chloroflexota bacterium]